MTFYYLNSEGRTIDFSQPPYIGLQSNTLLDYEWQYITQGQAFQRIVKFEKQMVQKTFNIVITGKDEKDYYANLDRFLQYTEVDINNLTPGRLYIGNYFLRCYISAKTRLTKYLGTNMSKVSATIICEKGDWQSEELFTHGGFIQNDPDYHYGIDYPYDYTYDFALPFDRNVIPNESALDAEFILTIYGPVQDPTITIGSNVYTVYYRALTGEYIEINSLEKKVSHVNYKGDITNVFMYRDRDNYIFEKIRHGMNKVDCEADMQWELRLFHERSEPKWSDPKWI